MNRYRVLSCLAGMVFLISSLTKLISADGFDMLLYGYDVFGQKLSVFLSRFIISMELMIALSFFLCLYVRRVSQFTFLLVLCFSALLLYNMAYRPDADCYCFGETLHLSNTWSLIKNAALLVVVSILWRHPPRPLWRESGLLQMSAVWVLSLLIVFSVSANRLFPTATKAAYCEACFETFRQKHRIVNKPSIICFLSPHCSYCKLTVRKMTMMAHKAGIHDPVLLAMPGSSSERDSFLKETKSFAFQCIQVDDMEFLDLTKGIMPLVLLYDGSRVVQAYRYTTLDEDQILLFLKRR